MHTAIDVGNTRVKTGRFERGKLVSVLQFDLQPMHNFYTHLSDVQPGDCILSSVVELPEHIIHYLRSKSRSFLELNSKTPLPIRNRYKSRESLGNDRLALAAGAASLHPGRACLVISAGTCITYNIIDKKAHFIGGAITPGLQMRYRAMHEYTARLPLVEPPAALKEIADSTGEAMASGVVTGIIGEIERFIAHATKQYPDICTILSGGDSRYLADISGISVEVHPDLALYGLYEILKFNEKKTTP